MTARVGGTIFTTENFKEGVMLKNLHYDMVEGMAELSKSIHRMDTYVKDASG